HCQTGSAKGLAEPPIWRDLGGTLAAGRVFWECQIRHSFFFYDRRQHTFLLHRPKCKRQGDSLLPFFQNQCRPCGRCYNREAFSLTRCAWAQVEHRSPMSPSTPVNERGLIPIVLGVVGHRDIAADARTRLESALQAVFDEFDEAYPNSPKVLLSPLAPGADQLAAEVALRRPQWSVRAPLPFEPDVFLQSTTFLVEDENKKKVADLAGQKKFGELRERVEWVGVPMPPDRQPADGDWARVARGQPGETAEDLDLRRACYANSGGYIVRHCQTLIALWDGVQEGALPSGTADIVRFKLGGVTPSLYPRTDDEPLGFDSDRGPVIVLHTPRAGSSLDQVGVRTVRVPAKVDNKPF